MRGREICLATEVVGHGAERRHLDVARCAAWVDLWSHRRWATSNLHRTSCILEQPYPIRSNHGIRKVPCRVREGRSYRFCPNTYHEGATPGGGNAIGFGQGGNSTSGPHLRLQEQNWAAHGTAGLRGVKRRGIYRAVFVSLSEV